MSTARCRLRQHESGGCLGRPPLAPAFVCVPKESGAIESDAREFARRDVKTRAQAYVAHNLLRNLE
jgi:hypothetical protein